MTVAQIEVEGSVEVVERELVVADLAAVARSVPAVRERTHIVPSEELAISSSEIRRRVRAGESIRGLAPPAVADYIAERRLYGAGAATEEQIT